VRPSFRVALFVTLLCLCTAGRTLAQYMKITTDNPADSTRLRSAGSTLLTITLNTNHDRDGSPQTCNSHTLAAGCGSVSAAHPLDLFSYTVTLAALGGTVSWGTFTAADPSYESFGSDLASNTQTEFSRENSGPFTPAGLVTLGTIPVTVISGAPAIQIAHGTQTIDPFGFGTGFGTTCDGFIYPNTYLLGDPAFVCGSGDWFDVDGAGPPDSVITPPCPIAIAGGPYDGIIHVPIEFDGTGTIDPDGDPLTYSWDFDVRDGVGVDATGPKPSHTYSSQNTYVVTLTVNDAAKAGCTSSATALASVSDVCSATIFNGYEPVRISTGKPWYLFFQPESDCYQNSDVDLSSIGISNASIGGAHPLVRKAVQVDSNGDGIAEIRVDLSKNDVRSLFEFDPSGTSLIILRAKLLNGGAIRAVKYVQVVSRTSTAVTVAPNPLNPGAILTYTTTRTGAVRVDLFDVQGRLVRRLVDEPALAAGTHQGTIDGRGSHGEKLPSGIYYIRGTSSDGEFKQLITILK